MKFLMNYSLSSYHPESSDDSDEYEESFREFVKQREKIRIPFLHSSPQIAYRPGIVKYLRQTCINSKFNHCSLHLAVYLLDMFMDCYNVKPDKILLLANVCLLIAVKFEENSTDVPKISELNAKVQNRYLVKEYHDLEIKVLGYFSWYIRFPTIAHYTHYYMKSLVKKEELRHNKEAFRTCFYRTYNCVLEYLHQVIDNPHYIQDFKPSQMAAAIMAVSRAECGLPSWTCRLEQLTSYTKEDIQDAVYTLRINKYSEKVEPLLPYSNYICTFRDNYCNTCKIKSCPKCFFLQKLC